MPRLRKTIVFPDYVRVKEPDHEALAELVLKAKGQKRSLNEFAKICGVNPSTLSRIVNQRNNGPCADALIRNIAENADADSGVTLEELLTAHGLAPLVVREKDSDLQMDSLMSSPSEVLLTVESKLIDSGSSSADLIRNAAKMVRESDFEKDASDIIMTTLIRNGYNVKMDFGRAWEHYDFTIITDALAGQGIDTWMFEVKTGIYSSGIRFLDRLFRDLYLKSQFDERKKVSLVIGDIRAFEEIRRRYWDKEIYDSVSIILVDRINRKVVDEFIIPQKGHKEQVSILLNQRERGISGDEEQKG